MKKVLFVIWSFSMGGGAEKVLSEILNNMDLEKYEISVLEYHNFGIKTENIPKEIKILNPILVEYKGSNKVKRFLNKINIKLRMVLTKYFPFIFRSIHLKDKYDVEIAFNYMIPTFLLSKEKNVKKICWMHGEISDLNYNNYNGLQKLKVYENYKAQKKSFNKCDNIIAISKKTYKSVIDIYPEVKEKSKIIYNGFDFKNIQEKSREDIFLKKEKDCPVIISLGRLDDNKNQKLLIDSALMLKEKKYRFKIYFLGDGDNKGFLYNYAKKLKVDDYIIWEGYIQNPYPYIKKADLMCITSKAEGFPTVAIEALKLKTFVVTTAVAGIEEITCNYKFCKIACYDAYDYANKIEEVLINLEEYKKLADEAENYVEKFSIYTQIKEIEELISN